MYKDYELSVNPSVTATSPTEYVKTFPPCTIEEVFITFPKGPNREVYTKIVHEGESVFPLDVDEWINGENETVVAKGPWSNWDGLFQLRIRLCSPGARLPHKVIFRFNLSEFREVGNLRNRLADLTSRLLPTG